MLNLLIHRHEIERKLKKEKRERKKKQKEESRAAAATAPAPAPAPAGPVNNLSMAGRENRSKERRQTIETKYDKKARAIEDLKALREKKKKSGMLTCVSSLISWLD